MREVSEGGNPVPESSSSLNVGVIYPDAYAAEEAFQLLKIPWEWYVPGRSYGAVIVPGSYQAGTDIPVIHLPSPDPVQLIATLLNEGVEKNRSPLVEIQLDAMRRALAERITLIEIPPVPWGYRYAVPLTHDVDRLSHRERRWPSVLSTAYLCIRGGQPIPALLAILEKMGLRSPPDPFQPVIDIEERRGVRSTFFLLPFRDRAGIGCPKARAGGYEMDPAIVQALARRGWEVAVHGIDNWKDGSRGLLERGVFAALGGTEFGNRVHWLLFSPSSWKLLEEAGYTYDTTFGYNEDIGYRAGTLQVYRPRSAEKLLELPLHVQDISLFGRWCWLQDGGSWKRVGCLRYSEDEAWAALDQILTDASTYGGAVTHLFHIESFGPPLSLDSFYERLIERMQGDGAWITRASEVVRWFRMRRQAKLECHQEGGDLVIRIQGLESSRELPPMRVRVHLPRERLDPGDQSFEAGPGFTDVPVNSQEIRVGVTSGAGSP
jgi:hypothetical protein